MKKSTDSSRKYHQGIDNFFDVISLPQANRYLGSSIKFAEKRKVWDKKAPADLIHFFETLECLLDSVFHFSGIQVKNGCILRKTSGQTPDVSHTCHYCGPSSKQFAWHYFPKYLNVDEYYNPYLAIKKFTSEYKLKKWRTIIRCIQDCSLSTNSHTELGIEMKIIKISRLLFKLVEACHLIYVRRHLNKTFK
jgi:hypothetical protein